MAQRTIEFATGSRQLLRGTIFQDSGRESKPAVLFVHGWKSSEKNYASRAEAVNELGYTCLTFNLRGHGSSDGERERLTISDHLRDVVAAYDFLAGQEQVDRNRMHIVGTSYGGYLSASMLSQRRLESLVLRAPAMYPDGAFNLTRQERKAVRLEPKYDRVLAPAVGFRGGVLLVESEHDAIIPHSVIEKYMDAARASGTATLRVIEGAGHTLSEGIWDNQFVRFLTDWFRERA